VSALVPEAALQQHIAVLGKTGSGKTFAAKAAIVEPLLAAGRRVGIVDPTDAWWGLRSSRDGKGAGFPVLVLGGDHGDLPLPAAGGAAVARLLVEQGVNLVASTKHLTVGERTRWFIDFAGAVSRLNRAPLHLVIDEAHNFAPQGKVPDPDTGRMLHAANTLASGGRSIGVRLVMITQRPQKLHKDALTSADTLIAMRVLAPHDRMAVEDWIKGCGDPAQGKEVLNSLAGLARGEGWVWFPEGGHLRRGRFSHIRTFDSSATPMDGGVVAAPKAVAELDLTEVRKALAEAVAQAEANDPKLLRRKISELEAALAKADHGPTPAWRAQYEEAHAKDTHAAHERGVAQGRAEVLAYRPALEAAVHGLEQVTNQVRAALERQPTAPPPPSVPARSAKPFTATDVLAQREAYRSARRAEGSRAAQRIAIPRAERLILCALAQYPQGRSKVQAAILTGYSVNGGGFANALGALRSAGRINGSSDRLVITEVGLAALGPFEPLPRGHDLLQHWYRQLGKAERKALEALVEVYPRTLSKAQVAARAGYEAEGGGFNNALGKLRSLELVSGRGEMSASEDLFG
jgi:hypothetical protein